MSRLRASVRPAAPSRPGVGSSPGQAGATATLEVTPPRAGALRIAYAPETDDEPDAGEVVWTWVPYAERDGRGKDRPVLVIARESADRVYAVKLTSRPRDADRDYIPIGAGEWDSKGRPSWADVDQIYSVHAAGMRREGAAVDRGAFDRVAAELGRRYGWKTAA
ncbi:type II toxin-antitoxin system PemK/MazF family toxin [Microbacterium sp. zg.Y1090]|uniref:type II toxin-antitoxin system PemK/MazF family toxin n=1 Tax=Microbacterium TaxID=33882 RepID=UPI00214A9E8B|nr:MULTISPECIES: type II toxin-antitoxin system PemK/MazF family toxin [unclassified Microbacterium]MCR2811859.1 type II toxin-antitoxin system PemK/MazF family toxin [Microbacterium sp. zg.Y1084]MCR2818702.1 type II toxin-antitoxin system PemK/MazF family toxin [Microbacterium sp. zg.Y1090]MDL5486515.1 type II toxin-antitoxin system PemK/MazF family toxin [Microbacterium sp. zg-Y1211]WIM27023.1 type II toxin-antitoxin system PemK/MazF family toxin [Microbacterium sp. zg-Y1090]